MKTVTLTFTSEDALELCDWLEHTLAGLRDELREARRNEIEIPLLVEIDRVEALQKRLLEAAKGESK